jgi:hypothetical protein
MRTNTLDDITHQDQEIGRYNEIHNPMIKRKVVCLCGSTKFKEAFIEANELESLKGKIVLPVGLFGHHEGVDMEGEVKRMLDNLHLHKIAMADEIYALN